jgi:hypothetical protein
VYAVWAALPPIFTDPLFYLNKFSRDFCFLLPAETNPDRTGHNEAFGTQLVDAGPFSPFIMLTNMF